MFENVEIRVEDTLSKDPGRRAIKFRLNPNRRPVSGEKKLTDLGQPAEHMTLHMTLPRHPTLPSCPTVVGTARHSKKDDDAVMRYTGASGSD